MWRRLLIILLGLAVVVSGAVLGFQSSLVERALASRLRSLVRSQLAVELELGGMEITALPPAVTLHGVIARRTDGAEIARLHRAHLVVKPWPSPSGALVIQRAELDGLRGDLTRWPATSTATPTPSSAPTAAQSQGELALELHELAVWNLELRLDTAAGTLRLAKVDASMGTPQGTVRELALAIGAGSLERANQRTTFEVAARGTVEGPLARPRSVRLGRAVVHLPRITAEASGGATLGATPELDVQLTSELALADLQRMLAVPVALSGQARVEVSARGPLTSPKLLATLHASNLHVERSELGTVDASLSLAGRTVLADSLTLHNPRLGRVTGSGSLSLDAGLSSTMSLRLHRVSLPEALAASGLTGAWVRGFVSGDLKAQGSLVEPALTVNGALKMEEFAVLDRTHEAADAVTFFRLPPTEVTGPFAVGAREVNLDGVRASFGRSAVHAEGTLSYDVRQGLNLRVAGTNVHLSDLGEIAGVSFAGHGEVAASIEGRYDDPVVSSTASITSLSVLGYGVGDARGTLIYQLPTLAFDRVTVRRGAGTVTGSGKLTFDHDLTTHAAAVLERVEVGPLLADSGLAPEHARRFVGKANGEAALSGPLLTPTGHLELHASALHVDGIDMGGMTFRGRLSPGSERAHAELVLEPQGGELDLRAGLHTNAELTLSGSVARVPAQLLTPFLGGLPMTGSLSGRASLSGPPSRLSGTANATLRDWTVAGITLEDSRLSATIDDGKLDLTGTLLGGAAQGTAKITLGAALPHVATFSFAGLALSRLYPLEAAPDLVMTGTLFSQGDLMQPDSLLADANLSAARLELNELRLTAARPVILNYAKGILTVGDAAFGAPGLELTLTGNAPNDGPLALRLRAVGALDRLGRFSSRVEQAAGDFDLDVDVSGTWVMPKLTGRAALHRGRVRVSNLRQAIEDIEASVLLNGRALQLETLNATLGGGTIAMGGQVVLGGDDGSEVNLRAALDSVALAPSSELSTSLSGNLTLQGPLHDLLLAGSLKLGSLRYTHDLDLTGMLPDQGARGLRVPAVESSEAVRLAVKVFAPNNIVIQNNVLDAELQADLTVTGTTNRVGLLGSLTPLQARARYRDNVFTVERASIDFTDEYRLLTQFDIHATTEACGLDVAIDIFGDSDEYRVVPAGKDDKGPVSDQDVWACLQFGLRLRDFEGHESAGLSSLGATLPGSLDALWTVSGMDEKVRKVLPIELDEIRLTSGWSSRSRRTTPRILVGKDLGKNLELKYSRSLEGDSDQNFVLEYRLSNVATLQGTWLTASDIPVADFGLDLRLRWELR